MTERPPPTGEAPGAGERPGPEAPPGTVAPGGAGADLIDLHALVPFAGLLGMELVSASPDAVHGRMAWTPERCTANGILHGGALMAFADTLGASCASLNLPAGAGTATIESKTNFFRAVTGGIVEGLSRPLHVGRTTIVAQTDLRDERGRLVAQVTQTQAVLVAR